MRRATRKHQSMTLKRFGARLTEINNFLPIFPGSDASNKMEAGELNNIILHKVPNVWTKKSYL